MEQEESHLHDITQKANEYLNSKLELGRLQAIEYTSIAYGTIISKLVLLGIGFLVLLFLSLGLAALISMYSGIAWLGYMVITGTYLLIFIILYTSHKRGLFARFTNQFIQNFNENKDSDIDSLPRLKKRILESESQAEAGQAALQLAVGKFAESLKPENIIFSMVSNMISRFLHKHHKEEEKHTSEEKNRSEFKDSLLELLTKLSSQAISKGVDLLSKKVFKKE